LPEDTVKHLLSTFTLALFAIALSPAPAAAGLAIDSNGVPLTVGANGVLGLTVNTNGATDFGGNLINGTGTLTISAINSSNGTITSLSSPTATIGTLTSTTANIGTLTSTTANIGTMTATTSTIGTLNSTTGTIANLNATTASVSGNLKVSGAASVGSNLTVTGPAYATVYFHLSDMRMKLNVHPVEGALEKIARLDGVSFNWKDDGRRDYGVTAQNVAAVFPEMVVKNGEGTMMVSYDSLMGPMIEAIKELKRDNEALREEVRILRNKVGE
jgi:hypothetical protein